MTENFETQWATEARSTFDQLPTEVQEAFLNQLLQLVDHYAWLYPQRPDDANVVGNVAHLQAPAWNLRLRMATEYLENTTGPILFVTEFAMLSQEEFDTSVSATRNSPDGAKPITE